MLMLSNVKKIIFKKRGVWIKKKIRKLINSIDAAVVSSCTTYETIAQ